MAKQWDKLGYDPAVDDHLDLLVAPISEVGEGPDRVHQNVDIVVVYEHGEGRQDFLDRGHWRRGVLNTEGTLWNQG